MMPLGQVSEFGVGLPGHFYNPIIYKIMWKVGYRSKTLLNVKETKRQTWDVVEGRWQTPSTTARLYRWVTHNREETVVGWD